jgi:hypothetical protein
LFKTLPLFLDKMESYVICPDAHNNTRRILNTAYDKILKSLFKTLDSMEREDGEDVTVNIVAIENMHYLYSEMRRRRLVSLDAFVKQAKANYDANLKIYCKAAIRKEFSKLQVCAII